MASIDHPRSSIATAPEILRWQVRWRALAAAVGAAVVLVGQHNGWLPGSARPVLALAVGYGLASAAAAYGITSRHEPATIEDQVRAALLASAAAYLTALLDGLALTAVMWLAAPAGHHDLMLVAGFFLVHLAAFSFNRRLAVLVLGTVALGYGWLTWRQGSPPLAELAAALVALTLFVAVAGTFIAQHESRRTRLRRIVSLFERAEDGDFDDAYDVEAETRPDVVTAVGIAYNRVRLRLESLVLTDPLTSCLNRRGFEQAIARELARAGRAGSEVALLSVDLDNFKFVNDTHGHLAGDDVLHQVGAVLLALVRTGDVVARTGGDEFMVLCPDTSVVGAELIATRVCDQVASHIFNGQGIPIRITVSVGVAALPAGAPETSREELERRSDTALYAAKSGGRNRASIWG